jgi:hypothetical protein
MAAQRLARRAVALGYPLAMVQEGPSDGSAADEADTTTFATAMDAKVGGPCPGYASQWRFRLDDAAAWRSAVCSRHPALGKSQRQRTHERPRETAKPGRNAADPADLQRTQADADGRTLGATTLVRAALGS